MNIEWPTNTGDLNRRIKIKPWTDVPSSEGPGIDPVYGAGINVWAKRQPLRGSANWQGQQIEEQATDLFWVRQAPPATGKPFGTRPEDLGGDKVIEHRGRRFRILRTMDAGGELRFTMIYCKDLGNA